MWPDTGAELLGVDLDRIAKYLIYKLNYKNWLVIDYNIKDKRFNMMIFNKEKIKKVTSYLEYEMDGPNYAVHIKYYKEI